MKHKWPMLLFINLFILAGCTTDSRNAMEKKIEGKWHQVSSLGKIADMDILIDYTFTNKKEFIQEVNVSPDKNVIYKNWPAKKGSFNIINDSIFLYNSEADNDAFYSAKILFTGDRKLSLIDTNGELGYERK